MKRVAFVLPYYGRFPSYFQLFLDSCGGNPDFDWLVFTDDHYPYDYPDNVHVHYETFEDMRRRVMGRIDAPVSLDSPYKLCDFKPTYGLVFSEYLQEYDWWGYCDCDVVFGRLGHFVREDMLDSYDKLFLLGHCSLYRNDDMVNRAFMLPLDGDVVYRRILGSPQGFTFDESYLPVNVNAIMREHGFRIFDRDLSGNLSSRSPIFRIVHYDAGLGVYMTEDPIRAVYVWDGGVLSRSYIRLGVFETHELMYMHFQRRRMLVTPSVKRHGRFQILPGLFAPLPVDVVRRDNFSSIPWRRHDGHRYRILRGDARFWRKKLLSKMIHWHG